MQNIKLVVSEIDGVLTSGKSYIDELGNVLFKDIYTADFEAINKLKTFCTFVFLSSDNHINYNLSARKNIPFYWAKSNKLITLTSILRHYSVTSDETLYIGSKVSDIPCMQMIPNSFCTNMVLGFPVLNSNPGEGVLTELYVKYFKHSIRGEN
jgi:3-deoxy-D-manno-octulosonate 8-phosphate phosphatase KdsC-like HAD superfamily phosphatase